MSDVKFQYQRPSSPSASTIIKTDEVGGAHIQYVKLDTGASGESAPANETNPYPVEIRATDGTSFDATGPQTGVRGLRVFIGPTDPISDVPVFIEYEHHQVHEGESHQYTFPPASLAQNASIQHLFAVPGLSATTRTPHLTIEVGATAETWVYLYEGPVTAGSGTQQTAYNRNRNSGTSACSTVWLNPSVSSSGSILSAWILSGGGRTGGATRDSTEWDLKASTNYLITAISKATGNDLVMRLQWYEDLGV